jgi:hypothetical protein
MAFGVTAWVSPATRFEPASVGVGAVLGLVFGWLVTLLFSTVVGLANRDVRGEDGKSQVPGAVGRGMLFLVPFAVMALFAVYVLGWSGTAGFLSAGLMCAGVAVSMEVSRLKGKQTLKNTVLATGLAWLLSSAWLVAVVMLANLPAWVAGGLSLLRMLAGSSGGGVS